MTLMRKVKRLIPGDELRWQDIKCRIVSIGDPDPTDNKKRTIRIQRILDVGAGGLDSFHAYPDDYVQMWRD